MSEDVVKEEFLVRSEGDVVRVDGLCRDLLLRFYDRLCAEGIPPADATALAAGADYYVRDYLVDARLGSIFDERRGMVRAFGGNWYIVNTLEPNLAELTGLLAGVREFYRYLAGEGLVSAAYAEEVAAECDNLDWYGERIESFWKISGGGFAEWEKECTWKEKGAGPLQ